MKIENDCNVRTLLEMVVIEYAGKQEDTQEVLRPLALAFLQSRLPGSTLPSMRRKFRTAVG